MQDLLTADHPVLALPRVAHRTLRSNRATRIIPIARMLLGMPLAMARDIATGVGMVRDIGFIPRHIYSLQRTEIQERRSDPH